MKKPNVLFITSDQLRTYELACYDPTNAVAGKPNSPNIDRLASESARFEYAFTSSPFCTPARASLLSGQYAPMHRTGDQRTRADIGTSGFSGQDFA